MTEIKLCSRKECTGCLSCKQVCRCNAIKVIKIKGFAYPFIDKELCVSCGLCIKSCPVLNLGDYKGDTHANKYECIAAWNKNSSIRKKSSSGGIFTALAEKVIADNGVVYGAAWDTNMCLEHTAANTVSELEKLRRSKYVQSDTKNTFNEVKALLKEGRMVLYCGTPCQIAGLTAFLGYKTFPNLIKVDVVCQGVPSQDLFLQYVQEVEKTEGVKVLDANFRSKESGWRSGLLKLLLLVQKDDKQYWIKRTFKNNSFYNAFCKEYFMRDSCYICKFKRDDFGYFSDITIADFWRIGNSTRFNIDNYEQGVSAVIFNNTHGVEFFNSCKDKIYTEVRTLSEFNTNGGLRRSNKKDNNDEAFEFLKNHTWKETQALYFPYTIKDTLRTALFLIIGEKYIRRILKFWGKIK